MGFLIHGFSLVFFRPGSTVKLYFSVPEVPQNCFSVRKTTFSVPKTLAQNPGQKPGQNSGQKSGHADHVLKTPL